MENRLPRALPDGEDAVAAVMDREFANRVFADGITQRRQQADTVLRGVRCERFAQQIGQRGEHIGQADRLSTGRPGGRLARGAACRENKRPMTPKKARGPNGKDPLD